MAKNKCKKSAGGGVNSHIRARLNYLYNAATYLQTATTKPRTKGLEQVTNAEDGEVKIGAGTERVVPTMSTTGTSAGNEVSCVPQLARVCISQMRGVSLKSQLRLPIEQKRSFCKRCDTLLVPGTNCTEQVRNPSRRSRKPWAEVRIVRCTVCDTEKRFPQTDKRSRKLSGHRKDQKSKNLVEAGTPA
ncbi:RNAse P Rpr2/Rpp21/SNM1 subunit domain-containing protein [Aspergillus egyptiacus]|nr:RNAse P Rpr2/Rpp21/SNM1 subunit domain-containing protein [Aspergillus egyptiacus]